MIIPIIALTASVLALIYRYIITRKNKKIVDLLDQEEEILAEKWNELEGLIKETHHYLDLIEVSMDKKQPVNEPHWYESYVIASKLNCSHDSLRHSRKTWCDIHDELYYGGWHA